MGSAFPCCPTIFPAIVFPTSGPAWPWTLWSFFHSLSRVEITGCWDYRYALSHLADELVFINTIAHSHVCSWMFSLILRYSGRAEFVVDTVWPVKPHLFIILTEPSCFFLGSLCGCRYFRNEWAGLSHFLVKPTWGRHEGMRTFAAVTWSYLTVMQAAAHPLCSWAGYRPCMRGGENRNSFLPEIICFSFKQCSISVIRLFLWSRKPLQTADKDVSDWQRD
jgi:hypothetical protein